MEHKTNAKSQTYQVIPLRRYNFQSQRQQQVVLFQSGSAHALAKGKLGDRFFSAKLKEERERDLRVRPASACLSLIGKNESFSCSKRMVIFCFLQCSCMLERDTLFRFCIGYKYMEKVKKRFVCVCLNLARCRDSARWQSFIHGF